MVERDHKAMGFVTLGDHLIFYLIALERWGCLFPPRSVAIAGDGGEQLPSLPFC